MTAVTSDLGWRADGIERALLAGGVELEVYRRPGFTGGRAVRRSNAHGAGGGNGGLERRNEPVADIEIIARRDPAPGGK